LEEISDPQIINY